MAAQDNAGQAPADTTVQSAAYDGDTVTASRFVGQEPLQAAGRQNQNQAEPDAPATSDQPDDFDRERAQALISKLRPFEKKAAQLEKALAEREAKLKEYEEASLTEQQKRERAYEEIRTHAEYLEAENRALKVDAAIEREALNAGAHYPDMIARLLTDVELEMDESGRPNTNSVRAAIRALKEERPALFQAGPDKAPGKSAPQPVAAGAAINAARSDTASGGIIYKDQLLDMNFWQSHRDEIMAAMASGRIKSR